MKFSKLTLAAAVFSTLASPVFAGEYDIAVLNSTTTLNNNISVTGTASVSGQINVQAESAATTDNAQYSTATNGTTGTTGNENNDSGYGNSGSNANASDPNWASLSRGAGNNASGNIGINVSAGNGNAQGNEVALAAVDADQVFATAQTFSTQRGTGTITAPSEAYNNATIDNALVGARGNINVNLAAGGSNLQDNQLSASVNSSGTVAKASGSNFQTLSATTVETGSTNIATLGENSLAGAQGNVGLNIAAGLGNQQHNSLAIAVSAIGGNTAATGALGALGR